MDGRNCAIGGDLGPVGKIVVQQHGTRRGTLDRPEIEFDPYRRLPVVSMVANALLQTEHGWRRMAKQAQAGHVDKADLACNTGSIRPEYIAILCLPLAARIRPRRARRLRR